MDLSGIVVLVWECDQDAKIAAGLLEKFGASIRVCSRKQNPKVSGSIALVSKNIIGVECFQIDPTYRKLTRLGAEAAIRVRMGAFVNPSVDHQKLATSLAREIYEFHCQ